MEFCSLWDVYQSLLYGPLGVWLEKVPALLIVILLHLFAMLESPDCHTNHQAGFKHERHTPLLVFDRCQLSVARILMRLLSGL
jgi:hypothetical protein